MINLNNLDKEAKEKLMFLGIKYLIERAYLADFPMPTEKVKTRKWSAAQRRKYYATLKRKKNEGK